MRTGTTISHYHVGALIGRGGMGEVYRATDTRLDRPVALKFLAARSVSDPEAKERFIREARAASALDHPNICTIHDIGETDEGDLYIVMALYEGAPLDQRLKSERFEVERTVHIVRQIAEALKRAHSKGIIHRDVKPANVMVADDDAVRLLDFGVAKLQSAEGLTQTGMSLGTADYMSPEQASGDPVTPASDVWSLGLIAYEMLGGERPFRGDNPLSTLHQIVSTEPTPLRDLNPEVPDLVARVVHVALSKSAGDRHADAAEFLVALDAATGRTAGTVPLAAPRTGPSGRALALVGLVVVAVVGVVALWPGPGTESASADADVVALFPFEVRGAPDFEYLIEGLPELMGDLLDGAGPLRTIDPRAVAGRLQDEPGRVVSAARAAELARGLGAGRFVLGTLTALPDRMTLSARMYGTNAGAAEPAVVSVDLPPDSLSVLIERVASGLLEASLSGANARIQQNAARTSSSPEATKAFLQGERFHRTGQFDSAAAAYNRALAYDSTLALAHLMKSMNNMYTYETDDYAAAVKAWEYSEGLPDRDRSLVHAFMDMQAGRLDEAEAGFLAHLKRWPDEVKALLYLGILYQRSNTRWGESIEEGRPYLTQVLQFEPGNVAALHRLSRMDAGLGFYDSIPARVVTLRDVAPESEWMVDAATLAAFTLNQTEEIERLTESYNELPLVTRLYSAFNALRFAEDPGIAEQMLSRSESGAVSAETGLPDWLMISDDLSLVLQRLSQLNGGRWDDLRRAMTDPRRPQSASWAAYDAELVASDLVPFDREVVEAALAQLQAADPEARLRNPFEPLHDIFTTDVMRLERDVTVAKLLGRLGRMDEAWALQRDIAGRGPFEGFHSLHEDAAGGLAADLHVLEGDRERALEILRSLEYQLPMTANSIALTQGSHAVFLRAELEREMGDPEVARFLYAGLVQGFAPPDKLFLAASYERLGELHEAAGRTGEARDYYDRLVRTWQDADAELAERRDAARARLEALDEG